MFFNLICSPWDWVTNKNKFFCLLSFCFQFDIKQYSRSQLTFICSFFFSFELIYLRKREELRSDWWWNMTYNSDQLLWLFKSDLKYRRRSSSDLTLKEAKFSSTIFFIFCFSLIFKRKSFNLLNFVFSIDKHMFDRCF